MSPNYQYSSWGATVSSQKDESTPWYPKSSRNCQTRKYASYIREYAEMLNGTSTNCVWEFEIGAYDGERQIQSKRLLFISGMGTINSSCLYSFKYKRKRLYFRNGAKMIHYVCRMQGKDFRKEMIKDAYLLLRSRSYYWKLKYRIFFNFTTPSKNL